VNRKSKRKTASEKVSFWIYREHREEAKILDSRKGNIPASFFPTLPLFTRFTAGVDGHSGTTAQVYSHWQALLTLETSP